MYLIFYFHLLFKIFLNNFRFILIFIFFISMLFLFFSLSFFFYVQNVSENIQNRRKQLGPACDVPFIPNRGSFCHPLTDSLSPPWLIKRQQATPCRGGINGKNRGFSFTDLAQKKTCKNQYPKTQKQHKTAHKTQAHNTNKTHQPNSRAHAHKKTQPASLFLLKR